MYLKRALEDVRADEYLLSDLMPSHVAHTLKRRFMSSHEDALVLPMYSARTPTALSPLLHSAYSAASPGISPGIGGSGIARWGASFGPGSFERTAGEGLLGSRQNDLGGGFAGGAATAAAATGLPGVDGGDAATGFTSGSCNALPFGGNSSSMGGFGDVGDVALAERTSNGGHVSSTRMMGLAAAGLNAAMHHLAHQQQSGGVEAESEAFSSDPAVVTYETPVGMVYQQWHSDVTVLFAVSR